ncbi:hypothetical protein F3K20_14030 [Streptomyces scabiei]|nr:hypothetical protein [Streptomyces sp. LBUM 1484]MBP5867207.1 hypothetical protein [Streptomyces sp. LBUM 1485]MBP5875564.1 hypothetical protein [Streptomyces sp. LBUM 1477]MBP5883380.1 hypothetical protein [Streptomyces sp. LBUM 1487]MBP5899407.1 hypothetical protein [Streptomyces sp. LBUM 1488]MBP5917006.1 hypothetical protein [Streptomyces sp. LBUM 1486]QTU45830.1 hypothetical protein F3K20_14030 [Streptomyces sp. LBUM 1482]QTU53855.1 hypothetical protein F3K21_13940 [Streptomyces sp. 
MKRAAVGVLVAAGLIFTAAGAALAAEQGEIPRLQAPGAAFVDGRYKFNPPGTNHGSFEWAGILKDTNLRDGHNVYVQVRVEGHGWARYYGKQRSAVRLHHSNWSGSQRYTDDAAIRVCRDRGALHPDNCSRTEHFSLPRD